MTISQPSKLVFIIDVPEVVNFTANFVYNFYTTDECVNDTGGVPVTALSRPAGTIDASFIQWSLTRVPREVDFSFKLPKLADPGNTVSAQTQRENNNGGGSGAQYGSLILDNLNKVVNEDYFAQHGYVAVNFHDGAIDGKIQNLVSGTLAVQSLQAEQSDSTSHYQAAQTLSAKLPTTISPHFVFKSLTNPALAYGGTFYTPQSSTSNTGGYMRPSNAVRATDSYYSKLKSVSTNVQINSKLFQDMIVRTVRDPTSTIAGDVTNLFTYAKSAKQATNQRFSTAPSASDYKTYVPYVAVQKQPTALHHQKYSKELVGFIIDKFEIMPDGTVQVCAPIVIDNINSATTADFRVKFNSCYCYTIRTIALLTLPAIDDNNNDIATVQVLVSSKPSNKVYVQTVKFDAPPPPGDVGFVWNYQTSQLLITWAFPVWSQQDIAQFQVFSRTSVNHPFQLQKVYNFDQSVVKFPDNENPDPTLVEYLTSPCQFYVDDAFDPAVNKSQAKSVIYAVSCIDAHGLSSPLSAQYQVWFDQFQNKLVIKHLSHLGAPKPYPNLYLDGELFVDTIKVSGPSTTTMDVYFNPQFYYVYDDNNKVVPVVQTQQTGGSYKLQFINIDNGKSQSIDVAVNDQTTALQSTLSTAQVQLGPRRRNTALQNSIA